MRESRDPAPTGEAHLALRQYATSMRPLLLTLVAAVLGPDSPELRLIALRGPAERARALRSFPARQAHEDAVRSGLDWLARHQEADGHWDADGFPTRCDGDPCTGLGKGQHGEDIPCPFDDAISALATLAFLGHGHLPGAEGDKYATFVTRAFEHLSQARSRFGITLATQVFAEAEALEQEGRHSERVREGVHAILEWRQEDGAFGYAAPFRPGSDVPFTALAVQALVAARDAGVALPEDLGPEVSAFLARLEEKNGKLAYLLDGRSYGYTPTTTNGHCAAAIRLLLQTDLRSARHRDHMALIGREIPRWHLAFDDVEVPGRGMMRVQTGNLSLYQWWYGTLATFHEGSATWNRWSRPLFRELLEQQQTRGCARGSWNPEGTYERQTGGRVLATALALLMLEQPYRHRRAR